MCLEPFLNAFCLNSTNMIEIIPLSFLLTLSFLPSLFPDSLMFSATRVTLNSSLQELHKAEITGMDLHGQHYFFLFFFFLLLRHEGMVMREIFINTDYFVPL